MDHSKHNLVRNTMAQKSTFNRLSRKFMAFLRWQMNKANTTKNMHVKIVGRLMMKTIIGRFKVQDT